MLGRSWWKCLGYDSPCSCAYEAHKIQVLEELERQRIDNNNRNRLKREKKKEAERKKKANMIWKVRVKRSEPGAPERVEQVVKHWTQPNYFDQIEALGFY
jgi:hypothetical protein